MNPIENLRGIVARLRAPEGCPWDREQTHASLRAGLIEEAWEVVEAIDAGDDANLCEELGDLLLQSVMHAQIAAEQGRFTFDDVARGVAEKLVRRHPHVFGETKCADSGEVLLRWDEIKRAEKGAIAHSALDGISDGLPALIRAEKVQKKAARVGFDWPDAAPVIAKVREEIVELEDAIERSKTAGDSGATEDRARHARHVEEELGDLLFSAVNLARKLGVDAEVALHGATRKFSARFHALERLARERALVLEKLSLAELDALWDEVKSAGAA